MAMLKRTNSGKKNGTKARDKWLGREKKDIEDLLSKPNVLLQIDEGGRIMYSGSHIYALMKYLIVFGEDHPRDAEVRAALAEKYKQND